MLTRMVTTKIVPARHIVDVVAVADFITLGMLAVILGIGFAVGILFLMNELRGEEKEGSRLPSESPTSMPTVGSMLTPSLNPGTE